MKWLLVGCVTLAWLRLLPSACADETLPVLKVGGQVYSNVTVTSVTATDLYFHYPGGMGNAKLKDVSPELQKHYRYDASRAEEVVKKQVESNMRFRRDLAAKSVAAAAEISEDRIRAITGDDGDLVMTKLFARSVRGERPPQIFVEDWLTPLPELEGKFGLVVFWATWAVPSRDAIPHLNQLQAKFKDRLVVIGVSDESLTELRKMTSPRMEFFVGTDPQARTRSALEVTGLPHSILIDPKGTVRFEGIPTFLDEQSLERLMDKYVN